MGILTLGNDVGQNVMIILAPSLKQPHTNMSEKSTELSWLF